MTRRLVSGTVAALAALVLAAGGSTLGAFDGTSDIPGNRAGAGVLQLDLGRSGSAGTALSFAGLKPGIHASTQLWVAANDAGSVVPATLSVTVFHLVDTPGPCDISAGKVAGEMSSGITGCVRTSHGSTGTPRIGIGSRLLDVSATYDPAARTPSDCAVGTPTTRALLPIAGPGNLYATANANDGAGTTVPVVNSHGIAIRLAPGRGVCFAWSVYWPPDVTDADHASPDHPVDNAAQGDSFSVSVRFDLTQSAA